MFVKTICNRFAAPIYYCVPNRCSSSHTFISKPPLNRAVPGRQAAVSASTPKQTVYSHNNNHNVAHQKPIVHNVLAKQLDGNDRLSVQRVKMQPFQRMAAAYMLYTHLGLKPDATVKDIKSAYYYLAKMYHPDAKSSKDSVARQKFLQISEAYEVLSDDKRRAEYDLKQVVHRGGVKVAERADTFHQKASSSDTANGPIILELPFLEAIRGVVREISVTTSQPCQACKTYAKSPNHSNPIPCSFCNGTGFETKQTNGPNKINVRCKMCRGTRFTYKHVCTECKDRGTTLVQHVVKVRVPAATNDNDAIQVLHPTTGRPLVVHVRIQDNDQFRRRGYDVFSNVFIPYSLAVLGGPFTIGNLFGGEMQVQIPPGTETDTNIRLAGKGIEKTDSSTHGDHVLVVKIKVPKNISDKQKSLLSAFATLENHPVLEQRNNLPRRSQHEAFLMAKKSATHTRSLLMGPDKASY